MLIDSGVTSSFNLLSVSVLWQMFAGALVVLAGLYFLFSLIVLRQVNLMTEAVITEGSSILRALSILHAGFALVVIIALVSILY